MEHTTPRPWRICDYGVGFEIEAMVDGHWCTVAQAQQLRSNDRDTNHCERKANARFIVLAVNSFEAMRDALEAILAHVENMELDRKGNQCTLCHTYRQIGHDALALAKEQP